MNTEANNNQLKIKSQMNIEADHSQLKIKNKMNTEADNRQVMDVIDLTSDDEEVEMRRSAEDEEYVNYCVQLLAALDKLRNFFTQDQMCGMMKSFYNKKGQPTTQEQQRDAAYVSYYQSCTDVIRGTFQVQLNLIRNSSHMQVPTEFKFKMAMAHLHLHELVERIQYETEARFTENQYHLMCEKLDSIMDKYREAFVPFSYFQGLTDPNDTKNAYAPPDELIDFDETFYDRKRKFETINRDSRYYK